MPSLTVSVPTASLAADVRALLADAPEIEVILWDGSDPVPAEADIVVPPYMNLEWLPRRLEGMDVRLIQGQAIGYDGVADQLPAGSVFANAASVHEAATAELAVALALAAQRELPRVVRNQDAGVWEKMFTSSLADRHVLLLGFGGVGRAIAARLLPFEVELTAVASRARVQDGVRVEALDSLPELLGDAEILINALPGGTETHHLIDDAVLAALPDGALVVNVGRGPTVDTDALVDHVRRGRLRVASDVFDPEPLPADHPLWSLPGVLVSPHMGGLTTAMAPRIARLVAEQARRMLVGDEPLNVVLRT